MIDRRTGEARFRSPAGQVFIRAHLQCHMGSDVAPDRMVPGRFYRVSYTRGDRSTTVTGRYIGREVTARGDDLVLAPMGTRIHIPLSSVTRVEAIEPHDGQDPG